MLAAQSRQLKLTQGPPTLSGLGRMLLEPAVVVGTLGAAATWYRVPFGGEYLILALLVFSLTFPARLPRPPGAGGIARAVVSGRSLTFALLLLLGWATRPLGALEPRVLLAWVSVAPAALFAAYLVAPAVLPRLMQAEGVRRKAVIAGAGDVGR